MQTYTAQISYLSSGRLDEGERSTTINFRAASPRDAARGVGDWWANRHYCLPDVFTKLLCVKVWRLDLQEFREDGYLPPSIGFKVIEWKVDTAGMLYPNYVEAKLTAT